MQDLLAFQPQFQAVFERTVRNAVQSCQRYTKDKSLNQLLEYLEQLTISPGKRVRPYLADLSFRTFSNRSTHPALDAIGCAIELFHLFALIHDDIIDQGMERHGKKTIHHYLHEFMRESDRIGDVKHIAEGEAMLCGDLLASWAHRLIHQAISIHGAPTSVAETFFTMVQTVIIGETLDVDLATRADTNREIINDKMNYKTASYTFVYPIRMGALLAGASDAALEILRRFGEALGLAFQIQDDLLDLTQDAQTLKKTIFSDLREGQHTVFTQYIFEHGAEEQQNELRELLRSPLTEHDRERVTKLFTESGSIKHGEDLIRGYFEEAETLLAQLELPNEKQKLWEELNGYIKKRNA